MKRSLFAALLLCCACTAVPPKGDGTLSSTFDGTVDFGQNFTPERLRVDLVLAGDATTQNAYLDALHRDPLWGGAPESLIDKFGYGQYFFELLSKSGDLIFSRGFSTLFEEWRTTDQAKEIPMAMGQTLMMPFPKDTVQLILYQRIRATGRFERMLEFPICPNDTHITPGPDNSWPSEMLQYNGDTAHKVNLAIAAEGYTAADMDLFRTDARNLCDYLFSVEPFASRRSDFNVYLVLNPSAESGVDNPNADVWRDTALDSSFDTFYTDRYLTITDQRKIASVCSGVPCDALLVIANESKYGGGGIYNSYAMDTAHNRWANVVFVHEFGHSFAGLGDEYYNSEVAYGEEYYPAGIEPWEPNITNLTDFASKWQDLVQPGTPVPTPNDSSYMGVTGVFEGAGYMTYGCFRPYYECRMLNNTAPGFCPVCQRAISRMIDFLCGVQQPEPLQ